MKPHIENSGGKIAEPYGNSPLTNHLWNFSCFILNIKWPSFIKSKPKFKCSKLYFIMQCGDECAQWNSRNLICQRKKNHREIISCLIYNFLFHFYQDLWCMWPKSWHYINLQTPIIFGAPLVKFLCLFSCLFKFFCKIPEKK